MSILKTTVLSQVFITNKVIVVNKIGGIKSGELTQKSAESKSRKLSKTRKSSKS